MALSLVRVQQCSLVDLSNLTALRFGLLSSGNWLYCPRPRWLTVFSLLRSALVFPCFHTLEYHLVGFIAVWGEGMEVKDPVSS